MIPVFFGKVEKGALKADARFYAWLSALEGLDVEIVVRKKRTKRSDPQNRYYWGVAIEMLSSFTGYSREEMHDALKEKFLGSERDSMGLVKIRSSASLSKDEFSKYTNQVVRWAAESLGLFIPDPNQVDY